MGGVPIMDRVGGRVDRICDGASSGLCCEIGIMTVVMGNT